MTFENTIENKKLTLGKLQQFETFRFQNEKYGKNIFMKVSTQTGYIKLQGLPFIKYGSTSSPVIKVHIKYQYKDVI